MTVCDLHTHAIIPDALRAMAAAHPEFGPEVFEEGDETFLRYPGGRARLGPRAPRTGPEPDRNVVMRRSSTFSSREAGLKERRRE